MAKRKKIDGILVGLVSFLLLLGGLILFSVSAPISGMNFGSPFYYIKHQIIFGLIPGTLFAVSLYLIPLPKLKKASLYLFLFNLFLSSLVFVPPFELKISGATRWLKIGSFSFQPAEVLKITLPLYLATWLTKGSRKKVIDLFCFLVILLPVGIILLAQPDFSTLIITFAASFLVYFLADVPLRHILILGMLVAVGAGALVIFAPYRMQRLLVFLNPSLDPMDAGYQIKQSLITIGSGGIYGKGIGLSSQKFGYLPNVISDSIFSVWCEETGLIGASMIIILFLLLFVRVKMKSSESKDETTKILAPALVSTIVVQAFLNIGAMTALVPLTGVPLPFISYGGSHLLTELAMMGLIFNLVSQK